MQGYDGASIAVDSGVVAPDVRWRARMAGIGIELENNFHPPEYVAA